MAVTIPEWFAVWFPIVLIVAVGVYGWYEVAKAFHRWRDERRAPQERTEDSDGGGET